MLTLANRFSKAKIFGIGFNKCGTTTLHKFLLRNYLRSAHWTTKRGAYLATQISHNLSRGRPLLRGGLDRYSAFFDICYFSNHAWIEGNSFFKEFHREYPDAYFILHDRPLDKWIRSRRNHPGMLDMACRFFNTDGDGVERIWREQYRLHKEAVLDYAPAMTHFLHFNIESDTPEKLADFLSGSFVIKAARYRHEKLTSRKKWYLQSRSDQTVTP